MRMSGFDTTSLIASVPASCDCAGESGTLASGLDATEQEHKRKTADKRCMSNSKTRDNSVHASGCKRHERMVSFQDDNMESQGLL